MQSTARDYWTIWKQFVLQGMTQEDVLPPALMQSWRRCAAGGLDPYGEIPVAELTASSAPDVSPSMLSLVRPIIEDLHPFVDRTELVVVSANANVRTGDSF